MQSSNKAEIETAAFSPRIRKIHWILTIVFCALVGICLPLRQIALAGTTLRGAVGSYGYGIPMIDMDGMTPMEPDSPQPSAQTAVPAPDKGAHRSSLSAQSRTSQ